MMGIDLLRELRANSHPRPVVPIEYTSGLISRAADEIERLRIMVATRDQEIANNQRRLKEASND